MRTILTTLAVVMASVAMMGQTTAAADVAAERQDVAAGTTRVRIEAMLGDMKIGDIVVRLYDATPIHRDNFVKLVKEGYYDGTLFHRVIKDFMIQGGDPNSKDAPADKHLGGGGPDYTLEAEIVPGLCHKRGALAAAREGDARNPERRSSGSQYYIVWGRKFSPRQMEYLADKMKAEHPETGGLTPEQQQLYATLGGSPHLDGQYTVFGEVEQGLDVVERIQGLPTGPADRPLDNIAVKMYLTE